ncbi:uncharacterized protein Tco025E_00084 [Trypanosoma conorhini]|uniref:Transmembrane protein n=1 Tax=Trypanosoma conorhini TaxID=83891 RepID=A0A422QCI9_9TRYP|nr:uncharacterized protein Tco025E_00084 [Trypanosoma conorhini]RNF27700.1 hypothetical protein Tco025E_00084 [Trypanosoma conorhini]
MHVPVCVGEREDFFYTFAVLRASRRVCDALSGCTCQGRLECLPFRSPSLHVLLLFFFSFSYCRGRGVLCPFHFFFLPARNLHVSTHFNPLFLLLYLTSFLAWVGATAVRRVFLGGRAKRK